jgi:hypothetical protein
MDDSQSPDPLTMDFELRSHLTNVGGDASSDYPDEDWENRVIGIARGRERRKGNSDKSYAHFFSSGQPEERFNKQISTAEANSDEEEESSDDLSEDDVRPNTRRHLKRGVQKRQRKTRQSSDESFTSNTGKRTSSRLRQTGRRNLKERQEDDEYSEVEIEAPKQKFSGAKEQFRELPTDDEFRTAHSEKCYKCEMWGDDNPDQGPLVFCQGCTSSYHQGCLGDRSTRKHLVTKVDVGDFILQCLNCLGNRHQIHNMWPHLGHCATCNEAGAMSQPLRNTLTSQEEQRLREKNGGIDPAINVDMSQVNNVDNVLVRCTGCKRGFHIKHLVPNPKEDRSSINAETWQCHDCSEAPAGSQSIQAIVAWRPKDPTVKVVPQLVEMLPEIDKEYLIKWTQQSYFHVVWMPGDWVWCTAHNAMFKAFFKSDKSSKPIMTTEEAVPQDYLQVDIIFDVEYRRKPRSSEERADPGLVKRAYVKFQGLSYEDTVWEEPPNQSDTERWHHFKNALVDKVRGEGIEPPAKNDLKNRLAEARKMKFDDLVLVSQPELVTGGELMEYQVDGMNWLYYKFIEKKNGILGDDMGLGKTLQVIAFFAALIENLECFPFLVVVPNSTVPNWRREIKRWAPNIRAVTWYGSAWARGMAEKHEMFHNGRLSCHVVIASYESMADEEATRVLSKAPWVALIVDEGQRLKNDQTVLYDRLRRMKFGFKVLLTGTPLQNNIRELFNLIQFLDPASNAEKLEAKYGGRILTAGDIRELHDILRPCFFRRTKEDVLPFLPPMTQVIIPISMSVVQKKLYKSILEKNPNLIKAILKKKAGQTKDERSSLNNILMQLRKCLCHPFIYNRNIEERDADQQISHRRLVEASCKLQLLDLMLPQLHEKGHRVLIFSQFLENLDIVEDFLNGIELRFCRLDGRLSSSEKQKQIDMFNAPNSPFFAFLLSTRSGGVGINLATADTVIIMDPDFNPKQDMQALSRAHRLGQKNSVCVFHLVVRASVEEKIMQKGKNKMALDHVLIEKMEADEEKEDLESILKHGAQALFDNDDSADIKYDRAAIENLLVQSRAEQPKEVEVPGRSSTKDTAQFNFARVWQKDRDALEEVTEEDDSPEDNLAWERILREREREAQEQLNRQAEGLGRGKRKRAAISYSANVEGGDDDEENQEPSPTQQSANKMRKIVADQDYQEADNVDDANESESDTDALIMDMSEDVALVDKKASQESNITFLPPMY